MTPTLSLCSFALWALAPLTLPADALADVPVALPTPAPETEHVRLAWDAAGDESQLRDGLSGSASLGVSMAFGNTESRTVAANVQATYEADKENRASGLIDFLYAQAKDAATGVRSETQDRQRVALQYDRFLTEELYAFLRLEGQRDGVQRLKHRSIVSGGLGYQLIHEKTRKTAVEAGFAYTTERYDGTSPDNGLAARLAGSYMEQLTDELKCNVTLEWLPGLNNMNDQLLLGTAQLEYNLAKAFLATLRYEFDYDNTPRSGNERLDHRVIWGLGYSF